MISLLTTVNGQNKRFTMHGIPISLLERQAESIGLPLYILDLTPDGDMFHDQSAMSQAVEHFRQQGDFLSETKIKKEKQTSERNK